MFSYLIISIIAFTTRPVFGGWQYNLLMGVDPNAAVIDPMERIDSTNACKPTGFNRMQFPIEAATIWNIEGSMKINAVGFYRLPDCHTQKYEPIPELLIYLGNENTMGVNVADFKELLTERGEELLTAKEKLAISKLPTPVSFEALNMDDLDDPKIQTIREQIEKRSGEGLVPGRIYYFTSNKRLGWTLNSVVQNFKMEDFVIGKDITSALKSPASVAKLLKKVTETVLNRNPKRKEIVFEATGLTEVAKKRREELKKNENKLAGSQERQMDTANLIGSAYDPRVVFRNQDSTTANQMGGQMASAPVSGQSGEGMNPPKLSLKPLQSERPVWQINFEAMMDSCVQSGNPRKWYRDIYNQKLFYDKLAEEAEQVCEMVLRLGRAKEATQPSIKNINQAPVVPPTQSQEYKAQLQAHLAGSNSWPGSFNNLNQPGQSLPPSGQSYVHMQPQIQFKQPPANSLDFKNERMFREMVSWNPQELIVPNDFEISTTKDTKSQNLLQQPQTPGQFQYKPDFDFSELLRQGKNMESLLGNLGSDARSERSLSGFLSNLGTPFPLRTPASDLRDESEVDIFDVNSDTGDFTDNFFLDKFSMPTKKTKPEGTKKKKEG